MSIAGRVVVVSAALFARMMPLAVGLMMAGLFDSKTYTEAVLLITAANLCGCLPMLAVTPQVLRASDAGMAVWLASRGLIVGLPLILFGTLLVSKLLPTAHSTFFLFAYAAAMFVLGVTQSVLNQGMQDTRALIHAGAVTISALLAGMAGFAAGGKPVVVLNVLSATMLLAALFSFARIRIRHERAAVEFHKPHFGSDALEALWSGLFSFFVIAGLFLSASMAGKSTDHPDFVAFSLGLQMFSVVVFIPGALGSYFIPRLVRSGAADAAASSGVVVRSYAWLAMLSLVAAMALSPLCFRYLQVAAQAEQYMIVALIQLAAALAAINAAYNQVLVGQGRFAMLASFSLLWLLVVSAVQFVAGGRVIWIAGSLIIAYGALVVASAAACRRALVFQRETST